MPNDCWNHITFTADTADLNSFMENEFNNVPDWALKIKVRGVGGVVLNLWSRWVPDFDWLERMVEQYPSAWLKNEWHEEGGSEGVWVGTKRSGTTVIRRMEWEGMCIEEEMHRLGENNAPIT
jgi:hypothetical protein